MTQQSVINKNEFSFLEKLIVGIAIAFAIFGLFIYVISFINSYIAVRSDINQNFKSSNYGDFGSFIGGAVGALWTLVSVILFYLTLRLQRKELILQREELELTRRELEGQKNQMIQQNQTLKSQQFENTFFQMLALYNSIVNTLDLRNNDTREINFTGRDCFEYFYTKLNLRFSNLVILHMGEAQNIQIQEALDKYDLFYREHMSDLSHYFRTIYQIFKFIDKSNIEDKETYVSIVRAQFSCYEIVLLFYNCLHGNGKEKFKPLIEKHSILKNIDGSLIINEKFFLEYKEEAFKKKL